MNVSTKATSLNSTLYRRVRDALSSSKMLLWEFDLNNGILNWTGNVAKHFYAFTKSFDGTIAQYLSLVHEDDVDDVLVIINNSSFGEGNSFFNQHRIKWSDGSYHWMEATGNVVKTGNSVKLTGTVQDITEKKKIELEREDWRQKYELIAKSARLVVYNYDHDSGTIQWNGSTEELFGYNHSEIGHMNPWKEKIHPADLQFVLDEFDKAEINKNVFDIKYRFKDADGKYKFIHDKGVFTGDDKLQMLGIIADLTDVKEAEEALLESKSQFKSMIHDMNIGIGLYDKSAKPLLCNRMAYKLLGLTEEQFLGTAAYDPNWKIIHKDGSEFKIEEFPILVAIKTGKPVRQRVMGVHRPTRKDFVWLLVNAEPVFNSDGQFLHVICTFSDITKLRIAQNVIQEKNKVLTTLADELRAKNDRLLDFAQIVSHNLRSPISSIVSLLQIYEDGDDGTRAEIIQHIRNVSSKALLTTDELNQVLKIQQEDNVATEVIDLSELLKNTVELQRGSVLESNADIKGDFKVKEVEYPPIYMESIFLNFLSNSLKYRAKDRICTVRVSSYLDNAKNLMLEWKDNGIGLNVEAHKDDLFKLGKRFHSNEDSRGVGLFLIKNQVDVMGGTISVESKVGSWTKFKINFGQKSNE